MIDTTQLISYIYEYNIFTIPYESYNIKNVDVR